MQIYALTLARGLLHCVRLCHARYAAPGVSYAAQNQEAFNERLALDWTEHAEQWAISNHGGTPCTFVRCLLCVCVWV